MCLVQRMPLTVCQRVRAVIVFVQRMALTVCLRVRAVSVFGSTSCNVAIPSDGHATYHLIAFEQRRLSTRIGRVSTSTYMAFMYGDNVTIQSFPLLL